MAGGENQLVAWLRERLKADSSRVPIGIGDDMAAIRLDGPLLTITSDMLLDGVHFDTREHDYARIGRKALACSLSDCAGMACAPRAAVVSLALSTSMSMEDVQALYAGMVELADRYDCPIVGGDTTSWPGALVVDVAMVAEPMHTRGPILRSTARTGDAILVSGRLGGSLRGRHLDFEPRLDLARSLGGHESLHAMMDLTDGLAMDLHRMCEASECGAQLDELALRQVIHEDAAHASRSDGRSPMEHALSDGEDFELLMVGDASMAAEGLTVVGRIVPFERSMPTRIRLLRTDGNEEDVQPEGYEHFR